MSRIEEALKRAAAQRGDGSTGGNDELLDARRHEVETPVVSAWHFDRFPRETPGESAPDAPVPPVTAPAPAAASSPDTAVTPAASTPSTAPPAGKAAGASPGGLSPASPPKATSPIGDPVTFAPVAAVAPRERTEPLAGDRVRPTFSAALAEKLVVMKETSSISVEQYRKLAATLHQVQMERGSKVLMVASAVSGEGKTLTAVNLALTLSESYRRRVLLVDADLRRPQIHEVFQVPNVTGLNEGIKATDDQRLPVVEVSPRLVLLPAGRPDPDPMSLLTSDRMRRIITEAASAFDWVILDTPPVVLLPDTHLLARMTDLAVLVAAAGKTPYQMIARAVETLGRERIVGVVLNGVEESVVAATSGVTYGDRYYSEPPAVEERV